jgi:outer membrane protein assembly factor BamB
LSLWGAAALGAVPAAEVSVSGEEIFTESLTSLRDGTLIIGSATRAIYRAAPGASVAEVWTTLPADGPRSVFGVLAHEASDTLWACTGTLGKTPENEAPPPRATLYALSLATGAVRRAYPLPTNDAVCNDIAVDADGTVYATDTPNMQIVRLAPGASQLEIWAAEGFGAKGSVLDGIAILGRRVYVNTLRTHKLFAVPINADGSADPVIDLKLSTPIKQPDGMRAIGPARLLLGENFANGRAWFVDVVGDRARLTPASPVYANGAVAVTASGKDAWALDPTVNAEGRMRRHRAIHFRLE